MGLMGGNGLQKEVSRSYCTYILYIPSSYTVWLVIEIYTVDLLYESWLSSIWQTSLLHVLLSVNVSLKEFSVLGNALIHFLAE